MIILLSVIGYFVIGLAIYLWFYWSFVKEKSCYPMTWQSAMFNVTTMWPIFLIIVIMYIFSGEMSLQDFNLDKKE